MKHLELLCEIIELDFGDGHWTPLQKAMAWSLRQSMLEQLVPPHYVVGQLAPLRNLEWNWNADLGSKKVAYGKGFSSRREACFSAWVDYQKRMSRALAKPRKKK